MDWKATAETEKVIKQYAIDVLVPVDSDIVRPGLLAAIRDIREEARRYAHTAEAIEVRLLGRLLRLATDAERQLLAAQYGRELIRLPSGEVIYT